MEKGPTTKGVKQVENLAFAQPEKEKPHHSIRWVWAWENEDKQDKTQETEITINN
jgi:hypothetical protein